ncbi:hypothetical protein [Oleomonas cavernae]|uniref:hypothetical protein n=1 Tax=Oleomonas cavernae TaxID=2320859 RepID=UPI0018F4CE76|nr:hypothetical protein [Oleomonas cavernae]
MAKRDRGIVQANLVAGLMLLAAADTAGAQPAAGSEIPMFLSDTAPAAPAPVAPAASPAPAAAAVPAPAKPAANAQTVEQLLEQVTFWRQRGRNEMAQKAVDQALSVDPANLDALFQAGLIAAEGGRSNRQTGIWPGWQPWPRRTRAPNGCAWPSTGA